MTNHPPRGLGPRPNPPRAPYTIRDDSSPPPRDPTRYTITDPRPAPPKWYKVMSLPTALAWGVAAVLFGLATNYKLDTSNRPRPVALPPPNELPEDREMREALQRYPVAFQIDFDRNQMRVGVACAADSTGNRPAMLVHVQQLKPSHALNAIVHFNDGRLDRKIKLGPMTTHALTWLDDTNDMHNASSVGFYTARDTATSEEAVRWGQQIEEKGTLYFSPERRNDFYNCYTAGVPVPRR